MVSEKEIKSCLNIWDKAWWFFFIPGFRTIVFNFIVIFTTFRPICPPVFFRCWFTKVIGVGYLSFWETIRNTRAQLWLTESEKATLWIRWRTWFEVLCRLPNLTRNTGEHIDRNIVNITIEMTTIARKPWMTEIKRTFSEISGWIT